MPASWRRGCFRTARRSMSAPCACCSVAPGSAFLDRSEPSLRDFLGSARRVAFVPFAAFDHGAYVAKVRERLAKMELDVVTLDELERAEAIFVGGGNTFRLLKKLQEGN